MGTLGPVEAELSRFKVGASNPAFPDASARMAFSSDDKRNECYTRTNTSRELKLGGYMHENM